MLYIAVGCTCNYYIWEMFRGRKILCLQSSVVPVLLYIRYPLHFNLLKCGLNICNKLKFFHCNEFQYNYGSYYIYSAIAIYIYIAILLYTCVHGGLRTKSKASSNMCTIKYWVSTWLVIASQMP